MTSVRDAFPPAGRRLVAARLHAQRHGIVRAAVHLRGTRHDRRPEAPDVGRPPRAGAVAVRPVPARSADHARALAGADRERRRRLRPRHPRGSRRGPSGHADADLRLRRDLPRADDPRAQGPRRDRPGAQRADVRQQHPPARRLRPGRQRRPSDGRDRARRHVRLLVSERPGRGAALVPRPCARADREDALLRARRVLRARRRSRGRARAAARRVRRPDRAGRPRVQPRRLVPVRGERRLRVLRRHDPGQRRRGAAHARGPPALPPALRQRVERADLRPAPGQRPPDDPDRQRRRAARAHAATHQRDAAPCRAGGAAGRLPRLPSGLRDRAAQRRRGADDASRDALRRRARRRQRGGADPARPAADPRTAPEPDDEPPLGPQPRDDRRRAVADGHARVRPVARRRAAAARDDRAVAVAQPVEPQPSDAPARDAVPRDRAEQRGRARRRARLEGHGRASRRTRRSPCSRGSCPTPAATCSTATTSSTATRR